MQMIEIQVFEVCVVVGYASYSDCNEISQVQLYLKLLRLKHSGSVSVLTFEFEFLCRIQALFVIAGIIFGIYSLSPGSLTKSLEKKVLSKNANGYSLFQWANSKLNKDDVVFSMHRSISLGKSKFIAMDFVPFVDFKDNRSNIFVEAIYKKGPTYLLTYGYSDGKPILNEFKNCVGKMVYYKKDVGIYEARNPFNRGRKYDGYIFKITKSKIPFCIKK